MSNTFTWVQTHKELAQYLSKMEGKQKELIELLAEVGVERLIDENPRGNRIDLEEIDPFTFFCFINKYGDERRLGILQELAKKLDLNYPQDVYGIPSAQAQKVMMFPFKDGRNNNEIENLWQLFYSASDESITDEQFEQVLSQYGVGEVKITETLYYINPDKYFPINGPSKPYLEEVLGIDPSFNSFTEYLEVLEKIKDKSDKPFYEISHDSRVWLDHKESEEFQNWASLIEMYKTFRENSDEYDERYKWEAIKHFQDTIDLNAKDFTSNLKNSISKSYNLVYQNSKAFITKAVEYFPEDVREMFSELFDDTKPLRDRLDYFISKSEELEPKVSEKYGKDWNHRQDERTLSFYLTMRFPDRYPLYKDEIYQYLVSEVTKEESKPAGQKFFHYLDIGERLIQTIEKDEELQELATKNLDQDCYQGDQKWLIFQDILWVNKRGIDIDSEINLNDEKWRELVRVIQKINDEKSVRKFFKTVGYVLEQLNLKNDEEITYASAIDNYIQFTIGSRYVTHLQRKSGKVIQGFYVANDFLERLTDSYPNMVISDKAAPATEGEMTWVTLEAETVNVEDFFDGILALAQKGIDGQERSQFRSMYSDKHNPWIVKAALDESILEKLLNAEFMEVEKVFNADINYPLNTIFYGPPGTGKTYLTVRRAAEIVENRKIEEYSEAKEVFNRNLGDTIEFITFHQNYSYEDFIQGLRPDIENDKELTFDRQDGIFKRLADRALKNLEDSRIPKTKKKSFEKVFNEYVDPLVQGEVEELEVEMKRVSYFITAVTNRSIEFRKTSGGTDHTLSINTLRKMYEAESVLEIQGLSSYYSPLLDKLLELGKSPGETEIVERKNYVIIIDEINRANISRVFGELITLIEPDKRSEGEFRLSTKLPSGEEFTVPSNLYIIGTMNTADKSIALLDIALRRRFEFEAMYPKYHIPDKEIHDPEVLRKINKRITKLKGHDFQIGHSYFMNSDLTLVQRMNRKVIPLLLEYFMNDEDEVTEILKSAGLQVADDSWPLKITGRVD